jgi:hypothetical protein
MWDINSIVVLDINLSLKLFRLTVVVYLVVGTLKTKYN